jgi:hypothetical protein
MKLLTLYTTLFVLSLFAGFSVAAEDENMIKAAMLYNFAKFVEWPEDSLVTDNRIVFCIAGKSGLNAPLQQLQGKPLKSKTISVRQIARPLDVIGCQILFISHSESARLSSYLQQSNRHNILTVSDMEQFAESGGMIGFTEVDNRIRFEINPETAHKQRIQISSYLLNLARRVW